MRKITKQKNVHLEDMLAEARQKTLVTGFYEKNENDVFERAKWKFLWDKYETLTSLYESLIWKTRGISHDC